VVGEFVHCGLCCNERVGVLMDGVEKWFLLVILYLLILDAGMFLSVSVIRENKNREGLCPPPTEYSTIQYFTKGCDDACDKEGNPAAVCYTFCGRVIYAAEKIT